MNKKRLQVRTAIISDVHLGTDDCKAREVDHFLRSIRCRKLILNGDIIDGWQLTRGGAWNPTHTRFIRTVLKKMEKQGTEVVYLRGNHDDILAKFIPFVFDRLSIVEEHVHESVDGRRYLVLHGDVFDTITTRFAFISHLGDWGYNALLRFNRAYNAWRRWRGLEYWSLSKAIKARVKSAVNHISSFEVHLAELAAARGCQGVICGHIHTAADKTLGCLHYLNSGDWVESLTAVVEHYDGSWQLLDYADFVRAYPATEDGGASEAMPPDAPDVAEMAGSSS